MLGLKLKKRHCGLEFYQPQWLKPHAEFNTKKYRRKKKWRQRWKSVLQTNEQCSIRSNKGKRKKHN